MVWKEQHKGLTQQEIIQPDTDLQGSRQTSPSLTKLDSLNQGNPRRVSINTHTHSRPYPYNDTEEHGTNFLEPPPNIIEGDKEWGSRQVRCGKRHFGRVNRLQYLVRWKDYSPAHTNGSTSPTSRPRNTSYNYTNVRIENSAPRRNII